MLARVRRFPDIQLLHTASGGAHGVLWAVPRPFGLVAVTWFWSTVFYSRMPLLTPTPFSRLLRHAEEHGVPYSRIGLRGPARATGPIYMGSELGEFRNL